MPLYEYRCECGEIFERFGDPREATCPRCGQSAPRAWTPTRIKVKEGYPKWVDKVDYLQKSQADAGKAPTLPTPAQIKELGP